MLFGFAGGSGHADPLLPIARAAGAAGHEVAFACEPWMVERIARRGFDAHPVGTTGPAVATDTIIPLLEFDQQREESAITHHFASRLAGERAEGITELARTWRADLIVCDEVDFGAVVAADVRRVPAVRVSVIAAGGFLRPEIVAPALDAVRAAHGLGVDPDLVRLRACPTIAPMPPSLRDPDDPLPRHTLHIRPGDGSAVSTSTSGTRPTVYATLGTIFNMESGDLFDRLIAALNGLGVDAIVTVGPQLDPTRFDAAPNVRVERFVAQEELLPRCDAVVSHAGSGSVIGAIAHGLPSVLLPIGADQPNNARRCVALGVAVTLDPIRATPSEIGAAITTVLREPSYRANARALAAETAALPGPDAAVALIERSV
jgi:UDP:flavonoid glycosyltransferase YjiC (YdhE family)